MTENEIKLIEMIRDNKNPTQAFVTAMEIILGCLALLEPSESKPLVDFQESVGTIQA